MSLYSYENMYVFIHMSSCEHKYMLCQNILTYPLNKE